MVDLTPEEAALAAELPPSEWAAASDHVEAWCAQAAAATALPGVAWKARPSPSSVPNTCTGAGTWTTLMPTSARHTGKAAAVW